MLKRVRLTFVMDVEDEDEAWEVAEGLEAAAIKRDFREVNAWVEPNDARAEVLGTEDAPVASAAETIVRRDPNEGGAMMFGGTDGQMIQLGDERGFSG